MSRWERKELSALEAGELLGSSERQFRRLRGRFEEEGMEGLIDRRLGKASAKRVPVDRIAWMLEEYRTRCTSIPMPAWRCSMGRVFWPATTVTVPCEVTAM